MVKKSRGTNPGRTVSSTAAENGRRLAGLITSLDLVASHPGRAGSFDPGASNRRRGPVGQAQKFDTIAADRLRSGRLVRRPEAARSASSRPLPRTTTPRRSTGSAAVRSVLDRGYHRPGRPIPSARRQESRLVQLLGGQLPAAARPPAAAGHGHLLAFRSELRHRRRPGQLAGRREADLQCRLQICGVARQSSRGRTMLIKTVVATITPSTVCRPEFMIAANRPPRLARSSGRAC
jgi:hypothetical protein